ncbi:UvrD-helicase domain-containing protein [Gallionella capsiferriformans]|uniref:ATP-dependent DNA helicase Rep n=1 Tax=Gallionella capsiferriformans (strain ES-2) TaxID=395494 RepID=D9SF59_GALCS|nr:UvrD-helicase domain-containing protein [Gallionella capsiferriformans]ADL55156.1 UvrD/REP helicase [Gallionella capsiferriformans ES-2]
MLSKLNTEQREAAMYLDGPLLVLAGAGSGKTRVITHKIAYLVEECGYAARNIAAITFTNKAANEMRERVSLLLPGKSAKGLVVSTFHSLGMTILRAEAKLLGYKPQFSIFDSSDTFKIISELTNSGDKQEIRDIQTQISNWKSAFVAPEQAVVVADSADAEAYARIYMRYQETLRAYQAVDFDDLIHLPVLLFKDHPEALLRWQHKLRYLLIDEYQDTNDCQYQLTRLLAGTRAAFTAVGDDDQAIYAWRGASIENLHNLRTDYSQLRVIKLEQNYRSSQRILKVANALINHNTKVFEKKLWSDHGIGDPIRVYAARDDEHEAESVVMKLVTHKFENQAKFSDYAILYRSNYLSRAFEEQLRAQRVPYTVSGGTSFFDKPEIKDITAYLRLIANPDDDPAFIRAITTPKRGIGNATLEKLGSHAGLRHISLFEAAFDVQIEQLLPPRQYEDLMVFCRFINRLEDRAESDPCGELLDELLRAINYETWLYDSSDARQAESKWKNVEDFIGWLKRKSEADEKSLIAMVQTIALINMLEGKDKEQEAVSLSTLHAAKGLEFPHVFIIGAEEDILPFRDSDAKGIEEERRLMYVGVTRAERTLQISYCKRRRRGKDWALCEPSRFLEEMPQSELVFAGGHAEAVQVVTKDEGMDKLARLKAMLAKPVAES